MTERGFPAGLGGPALDDVGGLRTAAQRIADAVAQFDDLNRCVWPTVNGGIGRALKLTVQPLQLKHGHGCILPKEGFPVTYHLMALTCRWAACCQVFFEATVDPNSCDGAGQHVL